MKRQPTREEMACLRGQKKGIEKFLSGMPNDLGLKCVDKAKRQLEEIEACIGFIVNSQRSDSTPNQWRT
jgi:hypothetical protein